MRGAILAVLLVSTTAAYQESNQPDATMVRWKRAQAFALEGFEPVSCFAGQVKVRGRRVSRQPLSLFAVDREMKCCGTLLKSAQTDQHGHFLIEPLPEGRYFAKFQYKGSDNLVSFAVVEGYQRCGSTHLEINFSAAGKRKIQDYIDINDSGEDCKDSEAHCYRK
jgi:hypothetical protein